MEDELEQDEGAWLGSAELGVAQPALGSHARGGSEGKSRRRRILAGELLPAGGSLRHRKEALPSPLPGRKQGLSSS